MGVSPSKAICRIGPDGDDRQAVRHDAELHQRLLEQRHDQHEEREPDGEQVAPELAPCRLVQRDLDVRPSRTTSRRRSSARRSRSACGMPPFAMPDRRRRSARPRAARRCRSTPPTHAGESPSRRSAGATCDAVRCRSRPRQLSAARPMPKQDLAELVAQLVEVRVAHHLRRAGSGQVDRRPGHDAARPRAHHRDLVGQEHRLRRSSG